MQGAAAILPRFSDEFDRASPGDAGPNADQSRKTANDSRLRGLAEAHRDAGRRHRGVTPDAVASEVRSRVPSTTLHDDRQERAGIIRASADSYVATQACLICGRNAHHLRFAQSRALGDEFTVPLCRSHHREAHRFDYDVQSLVDRRLMQRLASLLCRATGFTISRRSNRRNAHWRWSCR